VKNYYKNNTGPTFYTHQNLKNCQVPKQKIQHRLILTNFLPCHSMGNTIWKKLQLCDLIPILQFLLRRRRLIMGGVEILGRAGLMLKFTFKTQSMA